MNSRTFFSSLGLSIMIMLSGCGGGGGSSTPPSDDIETKTAYLIDSAVSGVDYTTSSGKSATTSSDGSFVYNVGDTNVSFSIGGLKLPDFNLSALHTDGKILPTDLVGVDRNASTDANVTKLLQIFQSLDSDGNPDNGITITTAIKALLTTTINVLDKNTSELNSTIVAVGKTMKSAKDVRKHFEKTLRNSFSFDIDTVAPDTPSLTTDINSTETNTTQITLNGEVGSKIYVNGIDINQTIDANRTKTITLDTNATIGNNNQFIITLKDSKNNISDSFDFIITKKAPLSSTTKLYIKSAIYDTNRTATPNDDKLYLYFNKDIKPSSISADSSENYDINGTGAIGSSSLSEYNSSLFYRHKLSLNSGGTSSSRFDINGSTKIYLKNNQITDISDNLPQDFNQTEVKNFNVFGRLQTGQSTTYVEHDDGNTTRGIARNFTNNGDDTVSDNSTGLMWQNEVYTSAEATAYSNDTETGKALHWATAITYCENLSLAGYDDWYLPSIEELVSITDKGRYNPSINPAFTNVVSSRYWSSTTDASSTSNAWRVYFYNGGDNRNAKTYTRYVRCVRATGN